MFRQLKVGSPKDAATNLGALISKEHLAKVLSELHNNKFLLYTSKRQKKVRVQILRGRGTQFMLCTDRLHPGFNPSSFHIPSL